MKKTRALSVLSSSILCVVSSMICYAPVSFAGILDELDDHQKESLAAGKLISAFEDSSNPQAPWPICKVYQKLDVSAVEAASVFYRFEDQKNFVPYMIKSQVTSRRKNETRIDYALSLPMGFGTEEYTAVDTLYAYDGGSSFKLDWEVIPTDKIIQSIGSARFEPLGPKSSVLAYTNFMIPNRMGARFVVRIVKSEFVDSVAIMINQVKKAKESPALLEKYVQTMLSALGN